jgi:ABC-type phosphate transport system auxiliary subunit
MTKTQEITKKLQSGISAKELISQGYKHGLVYKLSKQAKANIPGKPVDEISETPISLATDAIMINGDPEIAKLRLDLQKAELRRKLAATLAPMELEPRIANLENKIADLDNEIERQFESLIDVQTIINGPPLSDLLRKYKCSCGAATYLALKAECAKCHKEMKILRRSDEH